MIIVNIYIRIYQDQAAVRNLDSKFPLERGLPPRFYIVIRQTKCSSAKGELFWKDLRGILRSDNLRRLMSAKQRNQNPDLD